MIRNTQQGRQCWVNGVVCTIRNRLRAATWMVLTDDSIGVWVAFHLPDSWWQSHTVYFGSSAKPQRQQHGATDCHVDTSLIQCTVGHAGWMRATIVHGCTTTNTALPSTAIVSRETVVCANPQHATNTVFASHRMEPTRLGRCAGARSRYQLVALSRLGLSPVGWSKVQIGQQVVATGNSALLWVVLYVPETVFARFQSATNVFVASENLLQLATVSSSSAPLERLQGVADVFRGRRLLVMRAGTATLGEFLHATVRRQVGMDTRIAWVRPPNDGLLWDLAWNAKLQINNAEYRNSLLHRYRNDILQGLSPSPIHRAPPAQHVCFLSRQRRRKRGIARPWQLA